MKYILFMECNFCEIVSGQYFILNISWTITLYCGEKSLQTGILNYKKSQLNDVFVYMEVISQSMLPYEYWESPKKEWKSDEINCQVRSTQIKHLRLHKKELLGNVPNTFANLVI
jgi:hypothetical protein